MRNKICNQNDNQKEDDPVTFLATAGIKSLKMKQYLEFRSDEYTTAKHLENLGELPPQSPSELNKEI